MRRPLRITARTRLALVYAGLFALSGVFFAVLLISLTFPPVRAEEPKSKPLVVVTGPAADKPNQPALPDNKIDVEYTLGVKAQARREARNRLLLAATGGLAATTAASAGLGWLMAGRVLRPVHAVSATARRLSQRDLHERIPVTGPQDEMRELAETINSMLARLEQVFAAHQRFAANASHELRGPLTTIRALVDVAAAAPDASADLHQLAAELRGQLDRQQRMIDGLLALASSEHGAATTEPVRLDRVAEQSLATVADEAAGRGLHVVSSMEPIGVLGDPVLLQLMVDNLVRNAVRHNVTGGSVSVRVSAAGTVEVVNTGAEVAAERLDELVEPFRRGSRDRVGDDGVGLGLAITDAVARSHGATLRLSPRVGGGLVARVTLPLS